MLFKFPRGVRLEQKKSQRLDGQIETLPTAQIVILPLSGGESADNCGVKEGEHLVKFSALSVPADAASTFASVSGTVKQIKSMVHPLLGKVTCVAIETDEMKKELRTKSFAGDVSDADALIDAAQAAGIIDELDSMPLYQKLKGFRQDHVNLLVANALDDEPYVSSASATLQQNAAFVLLGLETAAKACGADERKIAVFHPWHLKNIEEFKDHSAFALLVKARKIYPAWPILANRLKNEGKVAAVIGVQACAALGRALKKGEPQTSAIVTVAGEGVESRGVFRVPIGTPIKSLLDACKLKKSANLIIMGSPLTGKAIEDLNTPVVASTRCILALEDHTKAKNFACIGCGKCTAVCPSGIMPWYINERIHCEKIDSAKLLNVQHCCHCNACTIICPSGIGLAAAVEQAAEIKEKECGFD